MCDTERVKQIRQSMLFDEVPRMLALHIFQGPAFLLLARGHIVENISIRQKRMHSVYGNELLCHGIVDAVVIAIRAGDSAQNIAVGPPAQDLAPLSSEQTRPVGSHS